MLEKIMEKRRQREDWGWGGGKSQISYRRPAVWAQLKATSPPSPLWRGLLPLVVAPWYVSDVSIISYVPCHIIDVIYMFYAHFMSYSCIFWN
jgi:hypothetical protein